MTTLTMRVDDVDASVVRKYAKFEGKTISDFIRDAVFEKIEDQEDLAALRAAGINLTDALRQNDAYPALAKIGGLLMTGPTGTNVNDLAMVLIAR